MNALIKMDRAISLFRNLDSELPTQVVSIFLAIARKGECYTRELPDSVGLSTSAVNRGLTYLGDHHWRDRSKAGLKLVAQRVDPMDRRQRIAELTPRGRSIVKQLEEILNG